MSAAWVLLLAGVLLLLNSVAAQVCTPGPSLHCKNKFEVRASTGSLEPPVQQCSSTRT
jgi:hypothetical protein